MTNENKYPSGGSGPGLQTVVIRKGMAACTDRIGGAGVVTHGVVGVATQSDATLTALEQPTPELVEIALRAQNQTRWSAVRNSEGETIHNPTAQDGMKAALTAIAAHLRKHDV